MARQMLYRTCVVGCASLLWAASTGWATIRYVDKDAQGTGTGLSWTDAYTELRVALPLAQPGDQIWVAAGTYAPGTMPQHTFSLRDDIKVYGGLAGDETAETFNPPDVDNRDFQANETILSGDLGGGSKSNTIVTGSSVSDRAILDGFTITSASSHAIANYQSRPTLANLRIVYNQAPSLFGSGAGMYNEESSSPSLTKCVFAWNASRYQGGAVYNGSDCNPNLTDCHLISNEAGDSGGGMYAWNSSPDLQDCLFANNRAGNRGGGLYGGYNEEPSSCTLRECTFSGNIAEYDGGGTCFGSDMTAVLVRCDFLSNSALGGGGGGVKDGDGGGG